MTVAHYSSRRVNHSSKLVDEAAKVDNKWSELVLRDALETREPEDAGIADEPRCLTSVQAGTNCGENKIHERFSNPPVRDPAEHRIPAAPVDRRKGAGRCFRYKWYNQTLCQVNGSVVRLGVVQGEYHWHKHDDDDEFFYVVEGKLLIDLEGHTVELGPRQGFVIPKGVVHRTRAAERTVMLMVENAGIVPTGT
jgi:mannose-6-phosphate isomerase-like protein (cupin superfamily)